MNLGVNRLRQESSVIRWAGSGPPSFLNIHYEWELVPQDLRLIYSVVSTRRWLGRLFG